MDNFPLSRLFIGYCCGQLPVVAFPDVIGFVGVSIEIFIGLSDTALPMSGAGNLGADVVV